MTPTKPGNIRKWLGGPGHMLVGAMKDCEHQLKYDHSSEPLTEQERNLFLLHLTWATHLREALLENLWRLEHKAVSHDPR